MKLLIINEDYILTRISELKEYKDEPEITELKTLLNLVENSKEITIPTEEEIEKLSKNYCLSDEFESPTGHGMREVKSAFKEGYSQCLKQLLK